MARKPSQGGVARAAEPNRVSEVGAEQLSCSAVVFEAQLQVNVRTVQLEAPGSRDVLVRTVFSGVSVGTERWLLTGQYRWDRTYPFIPGYERTGIIEWVGADVTNRHVGQRVFVNETRLADSDLSGKFFTGHIGYSVAPAEATIPLPDGLPLDEAAVSPLAAVAWNGIRMNDIGCGDLVVVIGQGMVGQMSAQLARLRGATVLATDLVEVRRELSAAFSADEVVDAAPEVVRAAVRRLKPVGADVVIDTTGRSEIFPLMVDLIRERGRICFQGYYPRQIVIEPHPTHLKQPTITFPCYWTDHELIMNWISRGHIKVKPFITHRSSFNEAADLYRLLVEDPGAIVSAVLDWSSQPDVTVGTSR
jgi:2-desacetyl-2-hydroxyethyl bacteriochlorophyllide A dehydrogenase